MITTGLEWASNNQTETTNIKVDCKLSCSSYEGFIPSWELICLLGPTGLRGHMELRAGVSNPESHGQGHHFLPKFMHNQGPEVCSEMKQMKGRCLSSDRIAKHPIRSRSQNRLLAEISSFFHINGFPFCLLFGQSLIRAFFKKKCDMPGGAQVEQKGEATPKGGPRWVPRGPTWSQVVPNDSLEFPKSPQKNQS